MKIDAEIRNGKLKTNPYHKERLSRWISKNDGSMIVIDYKKPKGQRSDRQNSYYWGVIIAMMCDETGYAKEELHNWLKICYQQETGIKIEEDRLFSTTELDTKEAEEYYVYCRYIANEKLSLYIPLPNEQVGL